MNSDRRNWPAIADIESQELRLFFMTDHPPEVMKQLPDAHPEFYEFGKMPEEFRFSLSQVKEAAALVEKRDNPEEPPEDIRESAELHWANGCGSLGIPMVEFWRPREVGREELAGSGTYPLMSLELQFQLQAIDDLETAAGTLVVLNGLKMLVVDGDGAEEQIWLARADHINLDS